MIETIITIIFVYAFYRLNVNLDRDTFNKCNNDCEKRCPAGTESCIEKVYCSIDGEDKRCMKKTNFEDDKEDYECKSNTNQCEIITPSPDSKSKYYELKL